jgi:hypothetical protein
MRVSVALSSVCISLISQCHSFSAFSIAKMGKIQSIMFLQNKCRVPSYARMRHNLPFMAAGTPDDEERELTNEECEILNLPYGTKLIGEMSDRYFSTISFRGNIPERSVITV